MQPSDERPPLKGVARSLDDLFSRVHEDQGSAAPTPAVPRRTPASPAPEPHDLREGPLLDADVLVQEISGPTHEQPRTDPEEERRARIAAAADSLAQAVEAVT